MRFWDTSALLPLYVKEPEADALVWAGNQTANLEFACLDHRLREAASREGSQVVP